MRVDRDADVELDDEPIETVEAVGIGVGREKAHAQLAREFKHAAVGGVILGEAFDAERDRRDVVLVERIAKRPDLRVGRRGRHVFAVQLDIAHAEHLNLLEGAVEGELAVAVALNADGEPAEVVKKWCRKPI